MPPEDGRTTRPPGSPRRSIDEPEAFGRGEHPEPNKDGQPQSPNGDSKPDDGKDEKKKDDRTFYKRPVLMAILSVVAVAAIATGLYLWIHGRHFESTDDAFVDGRIIHVSPRVAGKVVGLYVNDNEPVDANQVLMEIDPAPYRVKVDQAEASLGQAEAQLEQAKANRAVAQANADQAGAEVTVAVANALNAQQDLDRYERLEKAARSQQQYDTSKANYSSTTAQVESARARATSMQEQVKAADKTIESARASVKAAEASKEQAALDLQYTKVIAGHPGRVTRRTVEVGAFLSAGQEVFTVVSTAVPDDLWITANFKETQLAHMQQGQAVTITVDAYPDQKLRGHVDSVQTGTGAVFSLLPPENATGNYVKVVQRVPVKIVLDEQPRFPLSPGMSVEPEVDISQRPDPTADLTKNKQPYRYQSPKESSQESEVSSQKPGVGN